MIRRAAARLLLGTAVATAANGCALTPARVTRVADGVTYEGHFISPEAYGAYARGAALEARGELDAALDAYAEAILEDPQSPELWARVGAVRCRFAQKSSDDWDRAAQSAFRLALRWDAELAPAWAELARCAARTGRTRDALRSALEAARLDPDWLDAQLLVVELAEAAGRPELAATWLDALVVRSPESRRAWQAMARFAARHADRGRRLRAESALAPTGASARTAALDAALRAGDLPAARVHALALRQRPGDLALRAVELGALDSASEQAALALGADPDDADAWVAALAAADLAGDDERFERTLRAAPTDPAAPLSPPARSLLEALITRHTGASPSQ